MSLFDSILLGLLQGLTEFLPISSSGHLVLAETALHIEWAPKDLKAFDVILHAGTLAALLIYFASDWVWMLKDGWLRLKNKTITQSRIFIIAVATLPAVVIGLSFNDLIDEWFRSTQSVALMMFLVGFVLFTCEMLPKVKKKKKSSLLEGFIIGCAQSIALIPGVSRSGCTIAAAMFQGIERHAAAKFSFLLGTPAIAGATILIFLKIYAGEYSLPAFEVVTAGFLASFASSLICIHFLLQFVRNHSLRIFSLYLFIVSAVILIAS